MYLCYLDESGVVERTAGTSHFVLAGLAVPAADWRLLDGRIDTIKRAHGLDGCEIHTAWMVHPYSEQQRIPNFATLSAADRRTAVRAERQIDLNKAAARGRKAAVDLARNHKRSAEYIHLTHAERMAALRAVADEVGSWNQCALFVDANMKNAHGLPEDKILEFAFEQIVTRFNTYLSRMGANALGLLVQDHNETASMRLTALMRAFHQRGATWSGLGRIVETPLFVDSALTSMVQLADLCSYATRRFLENQETDLFDRIYPRFDWNGGKLVGARHYTAKTQCGCRICTDHGR